MNGIQQALLKLSEGLTGKALKIWQGNDRVPSQLSINAGFEGLLTPGRVRQMRPAGTGARMMAK